MRFVWYVTHNIFQECMLRVIFSLYILVSQEKMVLKTTSIKSPTCLLNSSHQVIYKARLSFILMQTYNAFQVCNYIKNYRSNLLHTSSWSKKKTYIRKLISWNGALLLQENKKQYWWNILRNKKERTYKWHYLK